MVLQSTHRQVQLLFRKAGDGGLTTFQTSPIGVVLLRRKDIKKQEHSHNPVITSGFARAVCVLVRFLTSLTLSFPN